MDPSHCTVVVATQPTLPPFNVEGQEIASQNEQPSFTPLLQSIFGQVYVHTGTADAVDRVKRTKNESPTMLLIDVDNATDVNEDEDDDTVHTPSCSSSCSTASSTFVSDSRISWIRKIVRELDIAFMSDIPVVVCSANESSSFMLDCVHAGAADYLIKPLRPDVIKTLFLKLHRCRPDSKMHEQPQQLQHHPHHQHHHNHHHHQQQHHSSRFPSSPPLPPTSLPEHPLSVEPSLCVEEGLQHRIREIYTKDDRLAKSMMDIYITALPMTPAPRTVFRGLSSERTAQLQHKISSWDFSPVDLSHDDLVHCSYLIFEQVLVLPEMSHLSITQDQLYDFIIDLSSAYHDTNPYHNFAHAVDVLQCLYYFLCRLGLLAFANAGTNQERRTVSPYLEKLLRPKDLFALLIAAIGHDAAHPGVNNMFLVNSAAPLALLYNDRSILESFHSMTLFQLVKKHGFDQIGLGLGSSDYHEFRKTVVTCILATDMALHSEYVEKIKAQAQRIHKFNELDDAACESERLLLCSAIIKCADISNVTRPFLRAAKWAELLIEESVSQGDLERALGLPILPLNDRQKVILEDSQIGFIRFVALELFQKVSEVLPEMSFTVDCIQENLRRWEQRKKNAATHDSGVASLGSNGEPEFQITGSKRRNSHAVEVLRKRLSLDTNRSSVSDGRRRSSVASDEVFTLPTMSAVAMESFNHRRLSVSHDDECPWPQQTAHNAETGLPTFCQCIIQ